MPYDPNPRRDKSQTIAEQRVRVYWLTLVSGAGSVVALVLHLSGVDNFSLIGPLIGGVAGSLTIAGIKGYTDSYYQQLGAVGMRWTMILLGILLLVLWANGETSLVARLWPGVNALNADGYLLALILGVAFHAGYAFAYLRDLATEGREQ